MLVLGSGLSFYRSCVQFSQASSSPLGSGFSLDVVGWVGPLHDPGSGPRIGWKYHPGRDEVKLDV